MSEEIEEVKEDVAQSEPVGEVGEVSASEDIEAVK